MQNSDFKKTVEKYNGVSVNDFTIFVDKTQFLPFIASNQKQTLLLSRPRRFGKSFNIQMIKHFFTPIYEIGNDYRLRPRYGENEFNTPYFKGGDVYVDKQKITLKPLKIAALGNQFKKYHGNIPVLHVNFINVRFKKIFEEFKIKMKKYISKLYRQHLYVPLSTMLIIINKNSSDYQKELQFMAQLCGDKQQQLSVKIQLLYTRLKDKIKQVPSSLRQFFLIEQGQFSDILLQQSLLKLAEMMKQFYNKQVLVLIDQYDAGISDIVSIYLNSDSKDIKYQKTLKQQVENVATLVSAILSQCGKGAQQCVYKCYMIGVTSSLIGHQLSGFNNVYINSLYRAQQLGDFFGFTQTEVNEAIDAVINKKNLNVLMKQELFRNMKEYYNGYGQDKDILFNPYSVTNHLISIINMKNDMPILQNHWLMSSWGQILTSVNITKQIYKLLSSITLQTPLQTDHLALDYKGWGAQQFIGQIISAKNTVISLNTLFYLLVSTGYLVQVINNKKLTGFRIPNKEVEQHFRLVTLSGWLKSAFKVQNDANHIVNSMSKSFYRKEQFQKVLRQQILKHFLGDCTEADFAAGIYGCLLVGGITKQFKLAGSMEASVESNKRLDTFFAPMEGSQGQHQIFPVLHEYKVNRSPTTSNESVLDAAMWQVFVNNYLSICSHIDDSWSVIIVRAIVFWKNKIQNKGWMVAIKQLKIPKCKVADIMALFEVKNLIKAMNIKKSSQKRNIRRDFLTNKLFYPKFLSINKVKTLDQLINNQLSKRVRQVARSAPVEEDQTYFPKIFKPLNIEENKPQSQCLEGLQQFQQIVQVLKDIKWAEPAQVEIEQYPDSNDQCKPQQLQHQKSIFILKSSIEQPIIQMTPKIEELILNMQQTPQIFPTFNFSNSQSQDKSWLNSSYTSPSPSAQKQIQQARKNQLIQHEAYFLVKREQKLKLQQQEKNKQQQQQQQKGSENDIWRNWRQNQHSNND